MILRNLWYLLLAFRFYIAIALVGLICWFVGRRFGWLGDLEQTPDPARYGIRRQLDQQSY